MTHISDGAGGISTGQNKEHQPLGSEPVGKVHWTQSRTVRAIAVGIGVLAVVGTAAVAGVYAAAIAAGAVAVVAVYFYVHRHDASVPPAASEIPEAGMAKPVPVKRESVPDEPILTVPTEHGQGLTPSPVTAETWPDVIRLEYFKDEVKIEQIYNELKKGMLDFQLEDFNLFLNETEVDISSFKRAAAKIENDLAGVRVQVNGWLEAKHKEDQEAESAFPAEPVNQQGSALKGEFEDIPIPVEGSFDIIPNGAVSPIVDIKYFLDNEFSGRTETALLIKKQGEDLQEDFYCQRVYGSGNCFYVAYLSGWLHHILRHQKFDEAINLLKSQAGYRADVRRRQAEDRTDDFIEILEQLKQNPSFEALEEILADKQQADHLAMYFRDFAVFGLESAVEILKLTGKCEKDGTPLREYRKQPLGIPPQKEDTWRKIWGYVELIGVDMEGTLRGGIIDNNPDLQRQLNEFGGLTKENYCKVQRENGADIQRAEMGILHDFFVPITMYQRKDIPRADLEDGEADGRSTSYGANNPVVIFRAPNHFDLLIPKKLT